MKTIIHLDALPEVKQGAKDHFALYDMGGFADAAMLLKDTSGSWYGKGTLHQAARMIRDGDLSAVPDCDKIMQELDGNVFVSRQYRVVNDVCGATPDVPAYIAGLPTAMRRRVRQSNVTAPLAVFVDLTTSGGIEASVVRKRGVAILALVRLLSNFRPVEAWAMVGLGCPGHADFVAVRLDTAPLDLARAAHVLTSTMVARGIGYSLAHELSTGGGAWPYGEYEPKAQRVHGAAIFKRVVHPGSDVLFVPPLYLTDQSVTAPVQWIKENLAKYGGIDQEAA